MKPCQITDEHLKLDSIQWEYLHKYGFGPEELKYKMFKVKGSRGIRGLNGEPHILRIWACCRVHARDEAISQGMMYTWWVAEA